MLNIAPPLGDSAAHQEVRQVMAAFATGVTIVTAAHEERVGGMTVNAFLSLSMEPPLVGVCLSQSSWTHALVAASHAYGVSLLKSSQAGLARAFARPHAEKTHLFKLLAWRHLVTAAPLLVEAVGVLDCAVVAAHQVADHTLFIARPLAVAIESGAPLIFYSREFCTTKELGLEDAHDVWTD